MRIRFKPWARPELEASKFYRDNPEELKGKWIQEFKNKENPIHLELGCGKGSFIAKLAVKNLNINYIGVDIKSEVLGIAKRNIEAEYLAKQKPIDNVLITSQEIGLIQNMLNEKDIIDRIYINFCNPWPKPRHNKRRLTYPVLLEKYKVFLKPEGEIYFKTDDDDLFEASKTYFTSTGFELLKVTYDLHSENVEENIITEHEEMFTKQGIKIKALIAKRK